MVRDKYVEEYANEAARLPNCQTARQTDRKHRPTSHHTYSKQRSDTYRNNQKRKIRVQYHKLDM